MANKVDQTLGIEKPIIQGPLFWLTNAKLVAAVSNAGGLGTLGVNAGQYAPTKSIETTMSNMKKEVEKTKQLTNKPFAINLILADDPAKDKFTEPMINLMVEEKVPVAVIYSTNYIPKWFNLLKKNGIKTVFRPATPRKQVLEDAIQGGVDVLVATGFDEGGTVPDKVVGTFSAVPYVVDIVNGRVPVMAAGGIVDARTTKAAFDLGAEGVFAGTAFLATDESPLADNIKDQLVKLDAYDEVMFKALPRFYRSLPGKLPNHLLEMSQEGKSKEEVWAAADHYNGMRTGMLEGDLDHGFASFGMGMSFIHDIAPVKTVVDRMYAGIPEDQR